MTDDAERIESAYLHGCGGAAGVAEFEPGQSFPQHYHRTVTEIFVCTKGSISISIGEEVHHLHPGQTVTAPPGVLHRTVNVSDSAAEIFYVKTPPAMEDVVFVSESQDRQQSTKAVASR
ncbi:cupin domain-containing protein [Rhodococcus sp. 1R11]|uniref:Cupin domain-containing protein n=1 Tax=Rhodococcus ruber TaxID=1830 RepID=A0ABT4MDI4_9NOCA|nr:MULTISPECIES: cupin domain-containing protein [Rhodococcus]MCZ4518898.1 cupin domain-containing protein [Rhodococcus ruber]TFI42435.1 cupin domain-containing protein [Rhodococcus sp. 1R11]